MPERRIAHAVSATPPAPALASSRVAAWPARVISTLARRPIRPCSSRPTARKRIAWPRKDSASSPSASASQRPSPWVRRPKASGRSATAGASRTTETTMSAAPETMTRTRRPETDPNGESGTTGAETTLTAMAPILTARHSSHTGDIPGLRVRPVALDGAAGRLIASLVEEEVRHDRARDARGEVRGQPRVAGARDQVVERDDAGQAVAVEYDQAADAVADHQPRGLVDVHVGRGVDDRGGGMVAHPTRRVAAVRQHRQRE